MQLYTIDEFDRLVSGPHPLPPKGQPAPAGGVITAFAPPVPIEGEVVFHIGGGDWVLRSDVDIVTSAPLSAAMPVRTEDEFRRLWTGMERMELDRFADQSAKAVTDGTASENQALFHTMWRDTMAAGRAGAIDLFEPYAIEGLDRIAAMPELPGITENAIAHVKAGLPAVLRPVPAND